MLREMSATRPGRTGPALLMLLLVTAGLFTMHTLGHFSMSATPMPMSHTAPSMTVALAASAAEVSPHQPDMPMGSAVACVAILCGLIVLALAVVLARRVGAGGLMLRLRSRPVIDAVRGPPRVLIGLCLADLAVARN